MSDCNMFACSDNSILLWRKRQCYTNVGAGPLLSSCNITLQLWSCLLAHSQWSRSDTNHHCKPGARLVSSTILSWGSTSPHGGYNIGYSDSGGIFIVDPRENASGTDVLLSSPEFGNVSPCSIYRDTLIENKALSPRFDCVAPITEVPPCCSLMFAAILHFTSSYTTSQASKPCIARVHNRAAYQTRCVIPFLSSYQEAISTLSTFSTSSLLSSSQSHHCWSRALIYALHRFSEIHLHHLDERIL